MKIQQLGPYRVVRILGRGGMGTVLEGVNVETGEPAAVKVLSIALAEEEGFRERFRAEIESLRKLNHPGIVRLVGFGEQDGNLFYAMELVEGVSLEEELQRGRRFPWPEVARIALEICRALRHAHDRGIVHRDLKPGNLLLGRDDRVRLADFGIARLFGHARVTAVGSVLGTAEYMSPEQAEGKPVDLRADLYSLGAVLYALLCRQPPFQALSLPEMLQMQCYTVPEPVGKYAPEVPQEFQAIVATLLEKDPEKRFPTALVLARRLEAMLDATSAVSPTVVAPSPVSPSQEPPPTGPAPAGGSAPDSLAPTLPADASSALGVPADPLAASGVEPDDVLSATKPTAAFQGLEPVAWPGNRPENEPVASAPPAEAAPSAAPARGPAPLENSQQATEAHGRFVVVTDKDRDRPPIDEPPPQALISLQTWVLVIGLIGLAAVAWYFLQPPTPDALYDAIAARTADRSIASLLEAESDIEQFLMRFPKDSRAEQLRKYEREIQLYSLERKFERRAAELLRGEGLMPVERMYLEAIQYARLDPDRGVAKLQALIELYDHHSDASGRADRCLELARRRLERLREQVSLQAAQSLDAIQERLQQADELAARDPIRARAVRQAVIDLYGDKPWAKDVVRRARAKIED